MTSDEKKGPTVLDVLSGMSKIPKPEVQALWEKVKENGRRLDACPGPHDFRDVSPEKPVGKKFCCTKCGGTTSDVPDRLWYERGLAHGRALAGDEEAASAEDASLDPREGPMHAWFGLTYASHLVVPRVIIQSMPTPWQRQLVGLLEQARAACEAAGVQVADRYYVRVLDAEGRLADEDLPHYRRAPLLGDPDWATAPRPAQDEDDPVEKEREEAAVEAFSEAIRLVEQLKGHPAATPEEMRQAALVALTRRSTDWDEPQAGGRDMSHEELLAACSPATRDFLAAIHQLRKGGDQAAALEAFKAFLRAAKREDHELDAMRKIAVGALESPDDTGLDIASPGDEVGMRALVGLPPPEPEIDSVVGDE